MEAVLKRRTVSSVLALVVASSCSVVLPVFGYPPHALRTEAPTGIEARALAVGAQAPLFSLPASSGAPWALEKALAKGSAVVVFYRGSW